MYAGSQYKYLRCITGRHDLPFYMPEAVQLQKSFLDAFLHGVDDAGWSTGKATRIELIIRKGNVPVNDTEAEKAFPKRIEQAWPIPRTEYTRFYLGADHMLSEHRPLDEAIISYKAPSNVKNQQKVTFSTKPFEKEVEFTGHVVAHLNVSASPGDASDLPPSEIDLFLTLRHLNSRGDEILYTGSDGDGVPICKGWLRVSLRKINEQSNRHTFWHPHREYRSVDQQPVVSGEIYTVDVELWPTSVVMEAGDVLVFEVASGDTDGTGKFEHSSPVDRPHGKLSGLNLIHFGEETDNYVLLPRIPDPQKEMFD